VGVGIGEETVGKVEFSFREAFDLSLKNIRRRSARAAITIVTIGLGISFLTFLTTASIFFRQHTETSISIGAYQYWLAFISLFLCVASITNSMTIAVYERYKEIGIIKCLGALNRHILLLFFVESAIMSLVGGVLGFLCGSIAAMAIYGFQLGFSMVLKIPLVELLFSFGSAVMGAFTIGISATVYPAYKAAKSEPVEAFRVEV
jgi:putative ABC transport system permease protein